MRVLTEDEIKHMTDRFLGWRLPANFNPDGGISFTPTGNPGTAHEYKREPSGTNLLDAVQAAAMVRYMAEGMGETARPNDALRLVKERIDLRLNNHLVEMKEGYDDSIVGFNEAWDIVRGAFAEALGDTRNSGHG
jgi:hypothetical protein